MVVEGALLESYQRDGFTKLDALLTPDEVNETLEAYARFVDVWAPRLTGRDINFTDSSRTTINSIHRLHIDPDGYFTRLLNSERMRAIAADFLGEEAVGMASEMFAKPAEAGLPSPAHQDNYYWCLAPPNALTLWIALDHCGPENGGLSYVVGSHQLGLLPHVASQAPGSSQTVVDQTIVAKQPTACPQLAPGDALVHHAQTVHFSLPNRIGRSRRGMTLQYRGASTSIDPAMLARYTAELESQVRSRSDR